MILRQIQGFKVIIVGFNLRSLGNGKAHANEYILNLVKNKGERVLLAGGAGRSRKGYVNGFGSKLFFKHMLFNMGVRLFKLGFNFCANLVCKLTYNRAFLCGKGTHLLEYSGKLAFFS